MGAYYLDWLNLFFRWFHVIAGVAWIGASFYFVWLDMSLRKPPQWKTDKGISGDLWAVHGGGFYEIAKYKLEPEEMPKTLHWFKWEAYTTWLTGMAMLSIVYYANATAYLVDPSKIAFSNIEAIGASLAFLFGSYLIYEIIVRSRIGKNAMLFSISIFILMIIAAWGSYQVFSDRASFIHVGAILGTIMAGNVFFGIMPAQRALVDCVRKGEKPGPEVARLALMAKNRSLMNNYFTLPLIFTMISNHYPMMYSHAHGWLVLVFVGVITATARHFFNEKHLGRNRPKFLVIPAIATVLLIIWMRPEPIKPLPVPVIPAAPAADAAPAPTDTPPAAATGDTAAVAPAAGTAAPSTDTTAAVVPVASSADDAMMEIVHTKCSVCHAAQPTQPGFSAPPLGFIVQTPEDIKVNKAKIVTALQTNYMPLGNITKLSDEERQQLIAYASGL